MSDNKTEAPKPTERETRQTETPSKTAAEVFPPGKPNGPGEKK